MNRLFVLSLSSLLLSLCLSQQEDVERVAIVPHEDLSGVVPSAPEDRKGTAAFLRSRQASEDVTWPFSRINTTSNNTCTSHTDCFTCTASSSWCHWCDDELGCHSKGSFYGCFSGVQCANHRDDKDDKHGCSAHPNCTSCATASRFCHWCGHDQACHAIGSVYGCASGVDCFSNDRCMRTAPERIKTVFNIQDMGALPIAIITGLGALLCCCCTVCFCVATGVKGGYDGMDALEGRLLEPLLEEESAEESVEFAPVEEPLFDSQQAVGTATTSEEEAVEEGEAAVEEDTGEVENEGGDNTDDGDAEDDANNVVTIDQGEDAENNEDVPDEEDPLLMPSTADPVSQMYYRRRSIRPRRPRHIGRLYGACTFCYVLSMTMVATIVVCSIRFYPNIPEHNICNDNVAWESLIESMKSIQVEADFEILASISNPNHISVALDKGSGSFTHNGKFMGTFDIPPFTAEAMSITDVLIIAHLSPERWDSFSIASEYYRGKLVLHVDAKAVIRVPALFDWTYEGGVDGIEVHVNELSDRHLCACPSWDEAKNHTLDFLEENFFLEEV